MPYQTKSCEGTWFVFWQKAPYANTIHMAGTKQGNKPSKIHKRDIEFMFEMSFLRRMPRAWQRFFDRNAANNAEHSFRVAWLALMIATYEGKGDHAKILKMALVHDLPESRSTDVDYLSRQYVMRNEEKARADVFDQTLLKGEMLAILKEYDEKKTIESQIVKDADNLDVDLEIQEAVSTGNLSVSEWKKDRKNAIYPKYYTKSAKILKQRIYLADPADWYLKSPSNRSNGGDWKRRR